MKILKSQLRKIIKEEIEKAVEEQYSAGINVGGKAMAIASGQREPEASNPVKVAARGVTRDKLSEEEGK